MKNCLIFSFKIIKIYHTEEIYIYFFLSFEEISTMSLQRDQLREVSCYWKLQRAECNRTNFQEKRIHFSDAKIYSYLMYRTCSIFNIVSSEILEIRSTWFKFVVEGTEKIPCLIEIINYCGSDKRLTVAS